MQPLFYPAGPPDVTVSTLPAAFLRRKQSGTLFYLMIVYNLPASCRNLRRGGAFPALHDGYMMQAARSGNGVQLFSPVTFLSSTVMSGLEETVLFFSSSAHCAVPRTL